MLYVFVYFVFFNENLLKCRSNLSSRATNTAMRINIFRIACFSYVFFSFSFSSAWRLNLHLLLREVGVSQNAENAASRFTRSLVQRTATLVGVFEKECLFLVWGRACVMPVSRCELCCTLRHATYRVLHCKSLLITQLCIQICYASLNTPNRTLICADSPRRQAGRISFPRICVELHSHRCVISRKSCELWGKGKSLPSMDSPLNS